MLLKGRLEGAWRTTVLKMSSPRTVTLLHQTGDITGFRVGSPSWPHSSKLALFDVLAVTEVASRLGVVQCSVPVDMRWQQSTTETEPRAIKGPNFKAWDSSQLCILRLLPEMFD